MTRDQVKMRARSECVKSGCNKCFRAACPRASKTARVQWLLRVMLSHPDTPVGEFREEMEKVIWK